MILLQTSDFTGFNYLNIGTNETVKLQAYIDRYEREYILKLLGVDLGVAFIDDLANVSQDARFTVIQDSFELQDSSGLMHISRGMVDFLCAAIAYHYVKDNQAKHSVSGVAAKLAEAGTVKSQENGYRFAEKRWNEALETAESIQWYCKIYDSATYPEYKGQEFEPKFSAFL